MRVNNNQAYVVNRPADGNGVKLVNVGASDAMKGRNVREKLPDYMIPTQFVELEFMPLSPHGKVDRNALPAPQEQVATAYVEPRTEMEKAVAQIWCEVLGLPRIGIEDNFFDLGGQSLLATQVIARVQSLINSQKIGVADLFEWPTITGLCKLITRAMEQPIKAAPKLVPLQRKR